MPLSRRIRSHSVPLHLPSNGRSDRSPRFSFFSLPYELRLEIYGYVFQNTLIHVRRRQNDSEGDVSPFVWAPCIQSSQDGSLCLSPNYSWQHSARLQRIQEACKCGQGTEHRAKAIKITALMWTCRTAASEALNTFCSVANIALNINDAPDCLRHINSIGGSQVRRMTLCGTVDAIHPPSFESGFMVTAHAEMFDSAPILSIFPNITRITIQICSGFDDCRAWNLWQSAATDPRVHEVEITMITSYWSLETIIIRRWQRMRRTQDLWIQDSMRCVLHRTCRTLPRLPEDPDTTDEEYWLLD